jgi:hypothetical protein
MFRPEVKMTRVARCAAIMVILAAACSSGDAFAAGHHVKVSGNIALIPPSPGVTVDPLPKRRVHVSWQRALGAAKKEWGLKTRQVEVIVRATVTDNIQYAMGWAVVADMTTYNPAPGSNTVLRQDGDYG